VTGQTGEVREGWQGRVAVGVTVVSISCALGGLTLQVMAGAADRPVQRSALSDFVVAVLFPFIGTVVLRREPRNRCGWVLLSCGLVGVSVLAHQWAYDAEVTRPGVLPFGELAVWLAAWTYWPYWLQPTLLPVLFPHGRAPTARWRQFVRVVLAVAAVGMVASMLKVDDDIEGMGLDNPLGLELLGPVPLLLQPGTVILLALVASPIALVGLARRQRRATGVERAQLQWLLLGFTACLVLGIISAAVPARDELIFGVGFAAIPLSIAVAIVRHGMFDVEVVVNRTIVYALLTGVSVVGYVGLVALVGRYVGTDGAGPVVAALVVALAASGRSRVQRLVDRRLFGARRDPMALIEQVGRSTDASAEPMQALAESVRESLRLPFVQVLDEAGQPVGEAGEPVVGTHVLPIVLRGRQLGVLVVGRRSRNERLRAEEQAALEDVARRAGSLLHTSALTQDLQQSYERTVLAREEERKRLRRDLHDGVGPALAGMALQLDSLAGRLGDDPALAARAESLRDRLRGTVGEVRGIVDGLRPAAVDELGLAAALQALATDEDAAVRVSVRTAVPDGVPAGVEVAAYRIVSEAVANAVRHAEARSAVVSVTGEGQVLRLEVSDDGRGFGAEATAGVGLQSLHERAAEVGGWLEVQSRPGAGTTVVAELPL
jgi:signal transduction histidine kinase